MADPGQHTSSQHTFHSRRRSGGTQSGVTPKARVSRACDRCRELRARCSGGIRCAKCTRDDATCRYSDNKREQKQKYYAQTTTCTATNATNRSYTQAVQQANALRDDNAKLVSMLQQLVDNKRLTSEEHQGIVELLERRNRSERGQSEETSTQGGISTWMEDVESDGVQSEAGRESKVGSEVGSPGRQQELPHITSLNHGAGLAGYVGKLSEASWMQRVREVLMGHAPLLQPDVNANRFDYHILQAMDLTYLMDDEDLLEMGEEEISPYQVPPMASAVILTEAYFHSLGGAFRFVDRETFLNELLAETRKPSEWPNRRLLALANMMWALGAKFLEITGLDKNGVSEGHSVYYARARALGLDHRIHLDHPNMQLVQGTGLLAFYLMTNGSLQRAWCVGGQAIRYATALGLHLRVAESAINERDHRQRSKLWHSLYRLEVLLSEITGRPKCIHSSAASISLDLIAEDASRPIDHEIKMMGMNPGEEWSKFLGKAGDVALDFRGGIVPWKRCHSIGKNMSEKHFIAATKLTRVADMIEDKLYLTFENPTWHSVQTTIRGLEERLQEYQDGIMVELLASSIGTADIDPRAYLELEMALCSTRMILYRPCLCDIQIQGESTVSRDFNNRCARRCVEAALSFLELLPSDPQVAEIYQVLPWWSILHYLCQAATALLLELCLNAQHMQGDASTIITGMTKAMNYVWIMSPVSKSAYKAWAILRPLLGRAMERYKSNAFARIPNEAQKPNNWSEIDDVNMEATLRALE